VRELIVSKDYPGDPAWIADKIVPKISPGKVKKSVELLQALELVRFDESENRWFYTDKTISTPSEVLSMAAVKYHQDMISLAGESLDRFDAQERDVRSITIGLSGEGYSQLKQRMEAFWREVLAFADTQECAGEVVQVNMQLFPLSKNGKRRKK
jgi:uncharacterized protein (TIGR02147 family)